MLSERKRKKAKSSEAIGEGSEKAVPEGKGGLLREVQEPCSRWRHCLLWFKCPIEAVHWSSLA